MGNPWLGKSWFCKDEERQVHGNASYLSWGALSFFPRTGRGPTSHHPLGRQESILGSQSGMTVAFLGSVWVSGVGGENFSHFPLTGLSHG